MIQAILCTSTASLTIHPQAFLSEADSKMADLLKLHSRMKQEYAQAVKFFGEDTSKMRVDDFFGTFASFMTDFEVEHSTSLEPKY